MYDALSQKTVIAIGIGEINPQCWIWEMDTWVTEILFMLALLGNY